MPLLKVAYNSDLGMVRGCLAQKQYDAKNTFGRGPHSCSAMVEYVLGGNTLYAYGNSQAKLEVGALDIYKDDAIKCHGESGAIAAAINHLSTNVGEHFDLSAIRAVYVELSPCLAPCAPFLENVNRNMLIMYSFDHPTQVPDWKEAAAALCRGPQIAM